MTTTTFPVRGHGPTRFLDVSTARSGQRAALGADVIDLGYAAGDPAYARLKEPLAALPAIPVPAVTLDAWPTPTSRRPMARHLRSISPGRGVRRQVSDAAHNPPQEAPDAFADAVLK